MKLLTMPRSPRGESLRVAILAPLHEPIPTVKYGGTERVVHLLALNLLRMGHSVTLCASGDSPEAYRLSAKFPKQFRFVPIVKRSLRAAGIPGGAPRELLSLMHYADLETICKNAHIVSNHFLPATPFLRHLGTIPRVTTLHGDPGLKFDRLTLSLSKGESCISISNAQQRRNRSVNWVGTVYNGIESSLTYRSKPKQNDWNKREPYLLFLGRISKEKGVHLAIKAALKTGRKLIIAGKLDDNHADTLYYERHVKPHLDRTRIVYIGETENHAMKNSLLGGADALLFPSVWPEPYGLVQGEALMCGTPVIAVHYPNSSVKELLSGKECGYVIPYQKDETIIVSGLAEGIHNIQSVSRKKCREYGLTFSGERMTQGYVEVFRQHIAAQSKSSDRMIAAFS